MKSSIAAIKSKMILIKTSYSHETGKSSYLVYHYGMKKYLLRKEYYIGYGSDNIIAFMAICHTLSFCKQNKIEGRIFCANQVALSWILKMRCDSPILVDNIKLRTEVEKAHVYLRKATGLNSVFQWDSKWGQIYDVIIGKPFDVKQEEIENCKDYRPDDDGFNW